MAATRVSNGDGGARHDGRGVASLASHADIKVMMMMQMVAFKTPARAGDRWGGSRGAARLASHTGIMVMLFKMSAIGRLGRGVAMMMITVAATLRGVAGSVGL